MARKGPEFELVIATSKQLNLNKFGDAGGLEFKGEKEQIDGYGLVKIPKTGWKENDAESSDILEPAIMTQSQRNFYDSSDGNY